MSKTNSEYVCRNCEHNFALPLVPGISPTVQCRRFPPRPTADERDGWRFPLVQPDFWCGEFAWQP